MIRRLRTALSFARCAYELASPDAWRHWGDVWSFWRLLYAWDAEVYASRPQSTDTQPGQRAPRGE